MKKETLWLIGAGRMAQEYAKVLLTMNVSFQVYGRGKKSALLFKKETGISVIAKKLTSNFEKKNIPKIAIVAVTVDQLFKVTKSLIKMGVKRILLEKPGGLSLHEVQSLYFLSKKKKIKVFIAYNRRFYQTVQILRNKIHHDGGLLSINFEFNEHSKKIKVLKISQNIKKKWLIANSSHVIDLAFHLSGKPKNWKCWNSGSLNWHPSSSKFCGSGITHKNIMFSYHANWETPGNWAIEFVTSKNRFILNPLEKLKIIKLVNNLKKEKVISLKGVDKKFKPGLYMQTKNFLKKNHSFLCTLSDQVENIKTYYRIAGY